MDPVAIRLSARNAWLHFRRPMQLHLPPAPLPKMLLPGPPAPWPRKLRSTSRLHLMPTHVTCYLLLVRFYDLGNLSGIMVVAVVFLEAGQLPGSTGLWPYPVLDSWAIGISYRCCWCSPQFLVICVDGGFLQPGVSPKQTAYWNSAEC